MKEQLEARWNTPERKGLADEVVKRLLRGGSLASLGLGEHAGLIDARGIRMPGPVIGDLVHQQGGLEFRRAPGKSEVTRRHWECLDLSYGTFDHTLFFDSLIDHCRFDGASCRSWGNWAVSYRDVSFLRANLRDTSFGAWWRPRRWKPKRGNRLENVDFTRADLRGSHPGAGTFIDCDFSHARLDRVEFSGPIVRCRFAGKLRETMFYARDWEGVAPENKMEDVDFTDAELIFVDFRELDLSAVRLPVGSTNLYVENYRHVLERGLNDPSLERQGLLGIFQNDSRWLGTERDFGIFHPEMFPDPGEWEFVTSTVERLGGVCTDRPPLAK